MKQSSRLKVLGITGGAGSGKSTVSGILGEFGAKIICADQIARQIMQKGYQAYSDIVQAFGTTVVLEDQQIDRKRLGEIVFADRHKLACLNCITHKYIVKGIYEQINEANIDSVYSGIVIDAALPLEKGFLDIVDTIWSVVADDELRIARLIRRGNYDRDNALLIIGAQISREEYIKLADVVIENNDSIDVLRSKVKLLWNEFLTLI